MLNTDCGIIYVAAGQKYVREAEASVASLRRHHPDISITLFSPETSIASGCFDHVVLTEPNEHNRLTKIAVLNRSPYEKSIFLDTDTHICGPLNDLFEILDRFDMAATLAPQEIWRLDARIPKAFVEHNSGVIAFRKGAVIDRLAEVWKEDYLRESKTMKYGFPADQTSFRYALYTVSPRIATLPSRFNCRLPTPGVVMAPVTIIHGRYRNMLSLERAFNGRLQDGPSFTRKLHLPFMNRVLVWTMKVPVKRHSRWRWFAKRLLQLATGGRMFTAKSRAVSQPRF